MIEKDTNTYKIVKKRNYTPWLFAFFGVAVIYIGYEVFSISRTVSSIKISDEKLEYIHAKVGDLVNVLNTKEESDISYDPTEKYDFKPNPDEIVADKPASEEATSRALKEEISKMKAADKIMVIRDRLVDIYQKSKEKDEQLAQLKQSFYTAKTMVEGWYNDKKNIKVADGRAPHQNGGIVDKLTKNLSSFVKINKVGEDLSSGNKKILNADQIPEMLSYAEILLEAGSLSQAAWIMEDIESITKQEEIFTFTSKVEVYLEKHPTANPEVQRIKELIELIENKE